MRTSFFLAGIFLAAVLQIKADPSATQANHPEGSAAKPAGSSAAAGDAAPGHCLTSTGSRLPPATGKCLDQPGHSFSQKDIESTGATNAADALRQMDPAVR